MVSYAQDPATAFKTIMAYRAAGQNAEALKLADRIISVYGDPKSRVAQQFAHYTPFFFYQKGEILVSLGEMDKAFDVFNELNTSKQFSDPELLKRSKDLPGQKEGYFPQQSSALFQMGYIRYQQATGKEGTPGDPSKFDECITLLEKYLKNYESGKVSKTERAEGLDGRVCFLLMQANLLKAEPDFSKAGEYLEKGRKAKAALPDDMVMGGLMTVMKVALENPQYIEWGGKLIAANPASFNLSADRMAPHSGLMFNFGLRTAKVWEAALRSGDAKQIQAAARTTYGLFSLVPDNAVTIDALKTVIKAVGSSPIPVPDRDANCTYVPERLKKLSENYGKMVSDNTELEAYATLTLANVSAKMGANRLAKAGYKMLLDRYPDMKQQKGENELVPMRDINYLQYAQLSRATGDEETAVAYENKIDSNKLGDKNKNAVIINKMATLVREKKWNEVVPAADAVLKALADEKGSVNYVSAAFSKLAACYMLKDYAKVLKEGEALLSSDMLKPGLLNDKQVREYETQALFFMVHACATMAEKDHTYYDKALAYAETFMNKYPSPNLEENPILPNVYYYALNALLSRCAFESPENAALDKQRALKYCDVIASNWPEHELYPTARLLAGNILINNEDDAEKPKAIVAYEECVDAALKMPEGKGQRDAANALFFLASYSPELDREGEDEAGKAARIAGYFNRFWSDADFEGNPYALQMASLQLSRTMEGKKDDKAAVEAYDKALKNAENIIAREANYAFKNGTPNPDLEKSLNSYVLDYVDGQKNFHGKELSLNEKMAHLSNFPGIDKADKYTNAILRMSLLTSLNEAVTAAKRKGENDRAATLEVEIRDNFNDMRREFKPEDLTNFINVQLGNYAVEYARKFGVGSDNCKEQAAAALLYFEQVLAKGGEMTTEAMLGKANALALSGDNAKEKEAYDLYSKLSSQPDPAVAGPALVGLTDLNMSTKNYKAAIESADKFVNMRNAGTPTERLKMMLKLGDAHCASGDMDNGILAYMNVFNQNKGNITFSAPACKSIMEAFWKRNNPAKGDRKKGKYTPSDRWLAWNTGQQYVTQVNAAKLQDKMTPDDRDKFREVTLLLAGYAKDAAVQKEEKERRAFQSMIKK